ncbi:MAG: discoidin domain-containing protein, partial [Muribaculaceae bacterium]
MITPNLFKILRALCIAVGISAVALNAGAAPRNLIVKANQLSSNCSYSGSAAGDLGPLSYLIDGNPDTYWHADYSDGTHTAVAADEYYIQIDNIGKISSGVSLEFFFRQRKTPNNHVEEFTIQIHKTTDAAGTFTTLPYPLVLTDFGDGASCNVVYNIPPLLNSASYIFDQIRLVPRKITSFGGGVSSYYTSNGTFHLAELQIKTKQILFNGEQMWSNCDCKNGSDDVTPLSNLLDYNPATYWHSDYNTSSYTAPAPELGQYIIDVFWFGTIPAGTPLHFYFQQRQITGWHVSKVRIQVHQTSTNDNTFVDLGELALQNVKSLGVSQNSIGSIPCDIDKIRIIVTQRGDDNGTRQDMNASNPGFHLAELHIATEPITIHGHGSPVNMRNTQYANVPNNPTY